MSTFDVDSAYAGEWRFQSGVYDAILVRPGETEEFDGKFKRESSTVGDFVGAAERMQVASTDLFGVYWKTGLDDLPPVPNSHLTVRGAAGEYLLVVGAVTDLPFSRYLIRGTLGV